ncbi:hypothetical protein ALC53_07128 [Atta colombica]|uniref:Uncharacterized protein n=1 Tax=Atta colombica TaxID=520822 RepID=A0A195BDT2_9HYME|nr:hypothetical protein ALC53_07128 [Atta colombica]
MIARVFSSVIYFLERGIEKEYTRKRRLECVKSEQLQGEEKSEEKKGEESKGEEHSSCVYHMRVEFYACLIWKWIA